MSDINMAGNAGSWDASGFIFLRINPRGDIFYNSQETTSKKRAFQVIFMTKQPTTLI